MQRDKLAKLNHPDRKPGDSEAAARMKRINDAFDRSKAYREDLG